MKLILELDAFSKFYPSEVLFIKFNLRKLSSVWYEYWKIALYSTFD